MKTGGLYGFISIPIFAILIGLVIAILRRYGCHTCANNIRAMSNYMMDINVQLNDNNLDHTPAEVNEALDNISTEDYRSSPVSSLSWDSRIQVEADRISQVIRDKNSSFEISILDKVMNDQGTQTSDQSIDINPEADNSTLTINLNAPLSPMDLFPSFTADIEIESNSDAELTFPKVLDFIQNINNDTDHNGDTINNNDDDRGSNN